MRFWLWGVRGKFVLFSLAVLSPVVIIAYLLVRESTLAVSDQLTERAISTAERLAVDIDSFIGSTRRFVAAEALLPVLSDRDAEELGRQFRQIIPIYDNRFHNIYVVDADGDVTASAVWHTDELQTIAQLSVFREMKKSTWLSVSDATKSVGTGYPCVTILCPIRAPWGRVIGAVGADVSLLQLKRSIIFDEQANRELVLVVDRNGRALIHPDFRLVENQADLSYLPPVARALTDKAGTMRYEESGFGGEWVAAYTKVPSTGWSVIVAYSGDIAEETANPIMLKGLMWLVAAVVFAVALAVLIGSVVTSTIRRLAESAHAIAAGDLGHKLNVRTGDEFQQLADDFNSMSVSLSQTLARLRQSEQDRQERAEHLQRILQSTFSAQEEERRRIAADIHDSVVQTVHGGLYAMQGATDDIIPGTDAAVNLSTAYTLFQRAAEDMNVLIRDLRPRVLEVAGLEGALRDYCASHQRLSRIKWSLVVRGNHRRLSPRTEIAVYRIVQEAVGNAERHSGAKEGEITIHFEPDCLHVLVSDNGRGFCKDEAASRADRHLGLASMQERALSIGGDLHIASSPGSGTLVLLDVPIAPLAEDGGPTDTRQHIAKGISVVGSDVPGI